MWPCLQWFLTLPLSSVPPSGVGSPSGWQPRPLSLQSAFWVMSRSGLLACSFCPAPAVRELASDRLVSGWFEEPSPGCSSGCLAVVLLGPLSGSWQGLAVLMTHTHLYWVHVRVQAKSSPQKGLSFPLPCVCLLPKTARSLAPPCSRLPGRVGSELSAYGPRVGIAYLGPCEKQTC